MSWLAFVITSELDPLFRHIGVGWMLGVAFVSKDRMLTRTSIQLLADTTSHFSSSSILVQMVLSQTPSVATANLAQSRDS